MLFNVQSTQQPNYHASGMLPGGATGASGAGSNDNSYTTPGQLSSNNAPATGLAPNAGISQHSNNALNQANLHASSQQYGSQNDDAGNSYLAYGTGGRV